MTTDQHQRTSPAAVTNTDLRDAAVRDIVSVAAGVVPFGIMLGVAAMTLHAGAASALLGSVLVYGGSAQLATYTVMHLGAGLLAAVASGAVVNARILLYGAALQPLFRDQPLWFRLLAPQFILDQTYLSAVGRADLSAAQFRRYWAWLGGTLLVIWTAAVAVGVVAGPLLPSLPHLALVPPCLFIAMLAPRLTGRTPVLGALVAAAAAVGVAHLLPSVAILVGTLAGVTASVVIARSEPS